ncbi:hypothetical protein DPMN_118262 [Dreissena polymorpha]|uniref:Uncharacterized protein n=1 Tax=Dreissena polymorpha TaxID=45954 RepID=A0A9D4JLH9_DREPO|nr:hypothetical protein DPMN_118262 [Dreissena polymorpha]
MTNGLVNGMASDRRFLAPPPQKKENKSTIRWECSQRRSESCKGTITTDPLTALCDSEENRPVSSSTPGTCTQQQSVEKQGRTTFVKHEIMRFKFWLDTSILRYAAMGEQSTKQKKKSTERYQRRLKTLCEQVANGEKTVSEILFTFH